jgi:hypothetical protein
MEQGENMGKQNDKVWFGKAQSESWKPRELPIGHVQAAQDHISAASSSINAGEHNLASDHYKMAAQHATAAAQHYSSNSPNKAGIHIKPENKGKFTAMAKRAGKSVQGEASAVLKSKTASPIVKKRANFAKNTSKWTKEK